MMVRGSEPRGAPDWRELAFTDNDAAALPLSLLARLCLSSWLCSFLGSRVFFRREVQPVLSPVVLAKLVFYCHMINEIAGWT